MSNNKVDPNWLDNVVGVFSPQRKFKRLQYRHALTHLEKRKYDGASRGRRTKNWNPRGTDANAETFKSLRILRNRSRDLVRNDAHAERGIRLIETDTVGTGLVANIRGRSAIKSDRIKQLWEDWAESTACDYDGIHNFRGLQRIVMRALSEGGEAVVRRRIVNNNNGLPPVQLQILEGDFINDLSVVNFVTSSGNPVIQGVEFDRNTGKRVAYHLFKTHPGSMGLGINVQSSLATIAIPADEIAHVFRQDRAGQVRGVPWMAPAMLRMKDLSDYEDAQLVRQKIASCFTAFVKDFEAVETETEEEQDELGDTLEPGIIEHLPPGKDISFADPPEVQNYDEYTSAQLRAIAVALGVSVAALTENLKDVNFSSGRMGHIQYQRNIDVWRWQILAPMFLRKTFNWFLMGADLMGTDVSGISASWTAPRREMIDPTKEVPAKIKAIRSGLTTWSEAIRDQGRNPEEHLEELSEDFDKFDEQDLTLDTDPRKTNQSGSLHSEILINGAQAGQNNNNENDDTEGDE